MKTVISSHKFAKLLSFTTGFFLQFSKKYFTDKFLELFERSGVEWSAAEWSAAEWSAAEWSAAEWSAAEWSAAEWSGAKRSNFLPSGESSELFDFVYPPILPYIKHY
jgi:hypothetical protein